MARIGAAWLKRWIIMCRMHKLWLMKISVDAA